jgi:hypothetical protein
MRIIGTAVLAACLVATSAMAEETAAPAANTGATAAPVQAGPHRVRGTIVSFDRTHLTVKADDGTTVTVALISTTLVIYNEPRKVTDIRPGDFVASAAVPESDGKLHSQEVRIFPEQMRGMGEGQYPMGDPATTNRSMTNATVAQVAAVGTGGTLTLTYHGAGAAGDANCTGHAAKDGNGCVGQTQLVVARGVPVYAYVIGDVSALIPGAAISLTVATGPDGNEITPRLLVEHNGVKPV